MHKLILQLKTAHRGEYLTVNHPVIQRCEIRKCYLPGFTEADIDLDREWQRKVYIDEKIVSNCKNNDIIPIKYTEVKPAWIANKLSESRFISR